MSIGYPLTVKGVLEKTGDDPAPGVGRIGMTSASERRRLDATIQAEVRLGRQGCFVSRAKTYGFRSISTHFPNLLPSVPARRQRPAEKSFRWLPRSRNDETKRRGRDRASVDPRGRCAFRWRPRRARFWFGQTSELDHRLLFRRGYGGGRCRDTDQEGEGFVRLTSFSRITASPPHTRISAQPSCRSKAIETTRG